MVTAAALADTAAALVDTAPAPGAVAPSVRGLTVRRAALADVPALARLLEPPVPAEAPVAPPALRGAGGLSREVLASALRLTLAHLGIDRGEVWVAVDPADRVVSGLAVLPPRHARSDAALLLALRLELRLEVAALLGPAPGDLEPAQACDDHWFLLPVGAHLPAVDALLHRALQGVDGRGAPVVTAACGPLHVELPAAGFRPVAACAGEVLVRDARRALPVQTAPQPRRAAPTVS